jgi:DNA-binding phage protein
MPSSRRTTDPRRLAFLNLAAQIETQLRDAFERQHENGKVSQSDLSKKLGVNRSAIHRRLMGQANMTIETIADMVWALDLAINVSIYDPASEPADNSLAPSMVNIGSSAPAARQRLPAL